jgi:hypothetical protein
MDVQGATREMSKAYTAVVHVTITAMAEVTPEEGGVNVKLTADPSVRADSILFFGEDAGKYTEDEIALMAKLCRFSTIKRCAEIENLPTEVAESVRTKDETKVGGALN